jgi:NAD-dependent deacetylase
MPLHEQIRRAAAMIEKASSVVALTGAGISTPSGIPDFRSPKGGLWQNANPLEVASIFAFRKAPDKFYSWVRPLTETILKAKPNPAHLALAALETQGHIQAVITQNIDSLHQAAKSQHVIEVHGHIRELTCVRCYKVWSAAPIFETFLAENKLPLCNCSRNAILKPNVILFGEQLPVQALIQARNLLANSGLVIVIGSSLEVSPIADMPHHALHKGAKLIIINYQSTYLDHKADLVINEDVTTVLPQIETLLRAKA